MSRNHRIKFAAIFAICTAAACSVEPLGAPNGLQLADTEQCDSLAALAATETDPVAQAEYQDAYDRCVIGNSVSVRQGLEPDNVDCASIYTALEQFGIDPSQLTAEIVRDYCAMANQVPMETCETVANACFSDEASCTDGDHDGDGDPDGDGRDDGDRDGEPDGNDGQDPSDGGDRDGDPDGAGIGDSDFCHHARNIVNNRGLEPDSDAAYIACKDEGFSPEQCSRIAECFGDDANGGTDGSGEPNQGPTCDQVYQELAANGVDPSTLSRDDVFHACLAQNVEEALCHEVADCFAESGQGGGDGGADGAEGGTDPNGDQVDCSQVNDFLEQQGHDLPLSDAEAQALRESCEQFLNDIEACEKVAFCAQQ